MLIRELSDLHLEFGALYLEPAGEDILILAGDIFNHVLGVHWARIVAAQLRVPILMVAGNHEFWQPDHYGHTWEGTTGECEEAAHHTDHVVPGEVTFLEDRCVEYQGVRFIGSTLWTDLRLFGENPLVDIALRDFIDYEQIVKVDDVHLSPLDTLHRHQQSRLFMTDRLLEPFEGPTVVISHHAPSSLSVPEEYKNDFTSAAFASRLEDLILDTKPALWVHGHTHNSFDYILGETRIVCNPRGYDGYILNPEFDPNFIVEV